MKRTLLLAVPLLLALPRPVSAQDTVALYEDACEEGELVACTVLGMMLEAGRYAPRDPARAAELYDFACERGESGACVNLGVLLHEGRDVPEDLSRAAELYQRACDGGGLLGCEYWGTMLENGQGTEQNFAAAVALYEQACDGGLLSSCTRLGQMAQAGAGTPQSVARAVALYGRACAGGDMGGCVSMGVSYERGEGIVRSAERASDLYRRACEGGEMLGCANLGSLYRTGSGVQQDATAALELYGRACLGGVMLACMNLGGMYEAGDGVEQDLEMAAVLYRRACDGSARAACERIGAPLPVVVPDPPSDRFNRAGRVADAETEAPLVDALFDVPALGLRTVTDSTGLLALTNVPAGDYTIRVQRMGYDDLEGTLSVPGTGEFLVLLNRSLIENLDAPGRILGRVTDEGGSQGVSEVDIQILTSAPMRAVTDGQGRFTLSGVEPGLVEVRFERLGYEPRTSLMVVQPGRTVEVEAAISTRPIELDPIEVVTVRSRYLEQSGFYDRARVTWGTQFTREAFEAIDPVVVSDVFYRVPGIGVLDGPNGKQAFSRRRSGFGGGDCVLQTYLDGVAVDDFDIDILAPEHIEAIEVYQGLATPIQYRSTCGVVLVWTRRG